MAIREYQPADEQGALDLLGRCLGAGGGYERSAAFWRWKHQGSPFGPSQITVSVVGEAVVGLRALMPWRIVNDGAFVPAMRAVDAAIDVDYRGQGAYGKLNRASQERALASGVQLFMGTPNSNSLPVQVKRGWTVVGRPALLVRPLSPLAALRGLWRARRGRHALTTKLHPGLRPAAEVMADTAGLDRLQPGIRAWQAGGLRTERSSAYLRWRYASAPAPEYRALPLTPGGPGTVIVRHRERDGLRELLLVELLPSEPDPKCAQRLVDALFDQVDADYMVAAARPGSLSWTALRRAGFWPVSEDRSQIWFTCLPLAGAPPVGELALWQWALGDFELL